MEYPRHIALVKSLLANMEAGSREMDEAEHLLPIERYTSEAFFQREYRALFRSMPLIVGHESQLPEKGGCFTHDASGLPLIVTRNRQGEVNTFINQCSHRSTRLLDQAEPAAMRTLVCPYHNWAYNLDGELISVPHREGFPNLCQAEHGLTALPTEVRHGLIWVLPQPGGALNLDQHLGNIGGDLSVMGVDKQHYFRQSVRTRQANWKLVMDAFLEAYHIKRLHKQTLSAFFMDTQAAVERDQRHLVAAVARSTLPELVNLPVSEWDDRYHVTFALFLIPNTIVICHPDYTSMINLFPRSVGESIFVHTMFIPYPAQSAKEEAHWQRSFELIDEGVFASEDYYIAEQMQRGMQSGVRSHLVLGRYEQSIRIFHELLDELMAAR